MRDPKTERIFEETKELHTRWGQFRDFAVMAMRGQQQVTPQAEVKFLQLKSRIAMLHDGFMEGLKRDHKAGMNLMSLVSETILLSRLSQCNEAERQKFEFDWNEGHLLLTEQVGTLEQEIARLATVSEAQVKAQRRAERMQVMFNTFLNSLGLKVGIFLAVLFMLLFGIPMFGIYDYRNFGEMDWSRPVYLGIVDTLWRPIFSPNFEYMSRREIQKNPNWRAQNVRPISDADFSKSTFVSNVLPRIAAGPNLQQAQNLARESEDFWFEKMSVGGRPAEVYFVFFEKSVTASDFIDALRNGVSAQPSAQRNEILNKIYIQRRANVVGINICEDLFRQNYLADAWGFPKGAPNLLAEPQ